MRISPALVGVVVGLAGGARGAEWWTSRGEFCLNECTLWDNFYWCYTVDPKDNSKIYQPTGHPDFFQHRDGLLVDLPSRWDYCTPKDSPSSKTSLWPNTACADECSTTGGRSICSTITTKEFKDFPKESVTLSSNGDAGVGKYQKQRMGTYVQTNLTDNVKGYPVYELDHKVNNKSQYLYAYADNTWRVGPNYKSVKGSALKSSKVKHSPTPHKDGWMFQKNGSWERDNWMDAIVNIGARGMVNISSTGNANVDRKSLMSTYTQLNTLVNGYPVYRQTERGNLSSFQYVFVYSDNWWVGPNTHTKSGAALRHMNPKGPTPPRKGWMYKRGGAFTLDEGITVRMEMEAKDWFYCSEHKPFKREQISAVEKLWCIGNCTRTDGSDYTCPTMFGRDKCSPHSFQNVKGKPCTSSCLPDGESYRCYVDNQLSKSELCGYHGHPPSSWSQKQSLEFTHGGKICAGLCEFPDAEETDFKLCKVASWKWNGHQSDLELSSDVCWGSRPWDTTTTIMAGTIVTIVVLFCCCVGCVTAKRSRDGKKNEQNKGETKSDPKEKEQNKRETKSDPKEKQQNKRETKSDPISLAVNMGEDTSTWT